MAYRMKEVVDSIEVVDLTGNNPDIVPLNRARSKTEVERAAPINVISDDENDDDNDDSQGRLPHRASAKTKSKSRHVDNHRFSLQSEDKLDFAMTDSGCRIQVGTDCELFHDNISESFRVKELLEDYDREVQMKGYVFVDARDVKCMIQRYRNELCAIVSAPTDDFSGVPTLDEHLFTRPLSSFVAFRKIVLTNQPWPAHGVKDEEVATVAYASWAKAEDFGTWVCRRKYVEFENGIKWNIRSAALVNLERSECDIGIPDAQRMLEWRNQENDKKQSIAKLGGKRTIQDLLDDESEVEEVSSELYQTYRRRDANGDFERRDSITVTERLTHHRSSHSNKKRRLANDQGSMTSKDYTYGDICIGAGGAASGARRAGLTIVFGLDHEKDPCATVRLSFRGTKTLEMSINDFCNMNFEAWMLVDILHISFPCQPYSVAHSRPGANDEFNIAAGFSVIELLKKCKPRIVTFEQSPNIAREHEPYFQALIHQLTQVGYSAMWKAVDFAEYDNAQHRTRLVVFASCPGQPLPKFPNPTHGDGPGLIPFTTIADRLAKLPRVIEPHMAETVVWKTEKEVIPYDANQPLKGAITCNGGKHNLHPSGERPFNNQELALLQGFTTKHRFAGSKGSIMKQLGNAVPGIAITPFFKQAVKALKKFDRKVDAYRNEVIEID